MGLAAAVAGASAGGGAPVGWAETGGGSKAGSIALNLKYLKQR